MSAGQKYHCQLVTVGEIENKKKMSEPSDKLFYILATSTDVLELADAAPCVRGCTATSVNMRINYCLRLFFSVVTPPAS